MDRQLWQYVMTGGCGGGDGRCDGCTRSADAFDTESGCSLIEDMTKITHDHNQLTKENRIVASICSVERYCAISTLMMECPEYRVGPANKKHGHGYSSKAWKETRLRVFKRDGMKCQAKGCWLPDLNHGDFQCDHIIPRSQGGSEEDDNLQTLCRRCHSQKTLRDTYGIWNGDDTTGESEVSDAI